MTTQTIGRIIVATFTLDGHHKVNVHNHEGKLHANCGTCAMSRTVEMAAVFATENQIYKITVDGAELTR
jgi:hypothetical protein